MPIRTHYGTDFTFENPEGDCFWHALSKAGLDLFNAKSKDFGKPTKETAGTTLSGEKCIRCRPDREGVSPWVSKDGGLLAIPKDLLLKSDWLVAGGAGDAHVLAVAALRGRIAAMPQTDNEGTDETGQS